MYAGAVSHRSVLYATNSISCPWPIKSTNFIFMHYLNTDIPATYQGACTPFTYIHMNVHISPCSFLSIYVFGAFGNYTSSCTFNKTYSNSTVV